MTVKLYEVGGCVRDELLGIPSKDVDYAVEAESFDQMHQWLIDRGFHVFLPTPEFLTIRARPPVDSALSLRTETADFVLCRKDSPGSDGRRPDYVEIGNIYDDLERRDFTVNAMARDVQTGELLDPWNGQRDLKENMLRFVGEPMKRITEDGLRVLRALRFTITKGFDIDWYSDQALHTHGAADMLYSVSIERIREELVKMFRYDAEKTFWLLVEYPKLVPCIFRDGLWLEPTLKDT